MVKNHLTLLSFKGASTFIQELILHPSQGLRVCVFIFSKSQLFCTLSATHQYTVPEVILLDDFRPNTMNYLGVLPQENIWLPRIFSSPNSFGQLCQYQSGYFPKLNNIFRGYNSSLGWPWGITRSRGYREINDSVAKFLTNLPIPRGEFTSWSNIQHLTTRCSMYVALFKQSSRTLAGPWWSLRISRVGAGFVNFLGFKAWLELSPPSYLVWKLKRIWIIHMYEYILYCIRLYNYYICSYRCKYVYSKLSVPVIQ